MAEMNTNTNIRELADRAVSPAWHAQRVLDLVGSGSGCVSPAAGVVLGPGGCQGLRHGGRAVLWTENGWRGYLPSGPPHNLGTGSAVAAASFLLGIR